MTAPAGAMSAAAYARVREVFRQVLDQPADARAAFVRTACADEPEVAAEVLSLLGYHDDRTLIDKGLSVLPADSGLVPQDYARFSLSRGERRLAAASLGLVLVLGTAGVAFIKATGDDLRRQLEGTLQATVDATAVALRVVLTEERARIERWATAPSSRDAARTFFPADPDATPDPGAAAAVLAELRDDLDPLVDRPGFVAAALVGRGRPAVLVAGVGEEPLEINQQGLQLVDAVLAGRSTVLPPQAAGTYVLGLAADPDRPLLTVAAPVHLTDDPDGPAPAAFVVSLDAERIVGAIPPLVRPAATGETYVFDGDGLLLTSSRHESDLRALGLIPGDARSAALRLRLGDPGLDLTAGGVSGLPQPAWPLTRMAAAATAGEDGVDTEGYRDYRGVPVVGAWRWLDDWDVGLATEMGVSEALAPLAWLWRGLGALVGAVVLAGTVAVLHPARLRRRLSAQPRVGRYRLLRLLGVGGMGRVYLARQARLKRPVALKLIGSHVSDRMVARFEREVQHTAALSHPNTIAVYDYGRTPDEVFYFAMEFLDGIDLAKLVHEEGPQPPARVVHILRQACGSLAEAHDRGLVHRDIKPGNLMLCRLGGLHDVTKVVDFGLAKDVRGAGEEPLTGSGERAGTPGYLAPECLATPPRMDARTDLYGLGAVAYVLLTGREAFERGPGGMVVLADGPPPPMREITGVEVPAALEELVLRCLAQDPQDRPESARALDAALAALPLGPWTETEAQARWADRPPLQVSELPD